VINRVLLSALLLTAATARPQSPAPATLYIHGNILTGAGLQPSGPSPSPARVHALAVSADGKIIAVGDDQAILALKTTDNLVIDLHGAFVMPGFNDAHTHMAFAGEQRLTLDLDNIPSLAAMLAAIKSYAATLPPGTWITGGGWDHTKWPASGTNGSAQLPTRQELDAVTGSHPAYLARTDGHIAIANTAALVAAGITAKTLPPAGGAIDHDALGEPTGIIRETPARTLIDRVVPQPGPAQRRRALTVAIRDALAHGVTSVQDFSTWDDFLVLEQMEKEGQLPLRFSEWLDFNLPVDTLLKMQASHDRNDPMLHTAMLKGFMDGSLGSRTAALVAPYSDDPTNSGIPRYDQAKLNQMSADRAAAGFQLGFHAIGDKANTMALDAFAFADDQILKKRQGEKQVCLDHADEAQRRIADFCGMPFPQPSRQQRFRIEHAQVLLPTDFDHFATLGIIASMQPSHLLTDMAWASSRLDSARIGAERSKYAYAWRSMLDHGITLAFGTDYPVESIDPIRGLYSAITRSNTEGTQTFHLEQKLTITESLYAYTQGSAYAQFAEKQKGILAPGYLADFVVLDHDLLTATPQQILHTKVLRTVVGGITRYDATTTASTPTAPFTPKPDTD
jgi:predicted amidohydrolase YtcJ